MPGVFVGAGVSVQQRRGGAAAPVVPPTFLVALTTSQMIEPVTGAAVQVPSGVTEMVAVFQTGSMANGAEAYIPYFEQSADGSSGWSEVADSGTNPTSTPGDIESVTFDCSSGYLRVQTDITGEEGATAATSVLLYGPPYAEEPTYRLAWAPTYVSESDTGPAFQPAVEADSLTAVIQIGATTDGAVMDFYFQESNDGLEWVAIPESVVEGVIGDNTVTTVQFPRARTYLRLQLTLGGAPAPTADVSVLVLY